MQEAAHSDNPVPQTIILVVTRLLPIALSLVVFQATLLDNNQRQFLSFILRQYVWTAADQGNIFDQHLRAKISSSIQQYSV